MQRLSVRRVLSTAPAITPLKLMKVMDAFSRRFNHHNRNHRSLGFSPPPLSQSLSFVLSDPQGFQYVGSVAFFYASCFAAMMWGTRWGFDVAPLVTWWSTLLNFQLHKQEDFWLQTSEMFYRYLSLYAVRHIVRKIEIVSWQQITCTVYIYQSCPCVQFLRPKPTHNQTEPSKPKQIFLLQEIQLLDTSCHIHINITTANCKYKAPVLIASGSEQSSKCHTMPAHNPQRISSIDSTFF